MSTVQELAHREQDQTARTYVGLGTSLSKNILHFRVFRTLPHPPNLSLRKLGNGLHNQHHAFPMVQLIFKKLGSRYVC